MAIERIILFGNDLVFRKNLEPQLSAQGYDVTTASTPSAAQEHLRHRHFDLAFLDTDFNGRNTTEFFKSIQPLLRDLPCVVTTSAADIPAAIALAKNDVFDFLIKPFSSEQIGRTLKKAEQFVRLLRLNHFLNHSEAERCELLGNSPAMTNLREAIFQVARTPATVLIQGESGSGKGLVARAIHRESARASAPFISANCALIPDDLIAGELFGHCQSDIPGMKREGCFELAHGGTILLDEIQYLSPTTQSQLLRVLQERELQPFAGKRTVKVEVRIIATTNRPLEQSVAKKTFRQDLYLRLNVLPIVVPPLRERSEDIPILAEAFVRRASRKHGAQMQSISKSARIALSQHHWPGNIRELRNAIERAVILGGNADTLELEHLATPNPRPSALAEFAEVAQTSTATIGTDFASLAQLEKQHILAALQRCNGNRTHAARLLDISIRTLRNKLHEYNGTTPSAVSRPRSTPGA